jgi:peptidoglycan/LPS O-acetylase OafA/YrhL
VEKAPTRARSEGARIPELDGLRGIAILWVLVFHFTAASGPLFFLAHFFQMGWIGVDLFFVLSGYLITGILVDSVGHRHYYRNFIVRRSLRIFPLYYATLVLYCILSFYPAAVRPMDFLKLGGWWYAVYLGNVKTFLEGHFPYVAILTPLWSLQVEEQFYLSFPLIVWAVKRKTLAKLLAGSIAFALLLRIVLAIAMPANKLGTYMLMPCRMDALAMGGLIAVVQRDWPERLQARWIGWMTAACALIYGVVCVLWTTGPWSDAMRTIGFTALDFAFAGVLVMLMAWRQRFLLGLCRLRFLVWVGTISYGLYLLHIPGELIGARLAAHVVKLAPHGSAEFVVSMAASLAMAWLSWTVFESQVLKLKRRFTVK